MLLVIGCSKISKDAYNISVGCFDTICFTSIGLGRHLLPTTTPHLVEKSFGTKIFFSVVLAPNFGLLRIFFVFTLLPPGFECHTGKRK
jgi:hypothetical protein